MCPPDLGKKILNRTDTQVRPYRDNKLNNQQYENP